VPNVSETLKDFLAKGETIEQKQTYINSIFNSNKKVRTSNVTSAAPVSNNTKKAYTSERN
jgi:hypothetical protein